MKKYLFFISQDYSFPVLRPLAEAILQRNCEVRWFMYGDEINKDFLQSTEIELKTIQEAVDYKPDAVFVPGNVVPSFLPGIKVEVFHGLPSTKAKKNGQLYHYIIRGMFDVYATQGPESSKKFQELADKYRYFNVLETGWSKLDPLFPVELKKEDKKKAIFFASTFSPRFSKAKVLYPLVLDMMKKYDYDWYITLHPKMDKEIVKLYKSINLENVKFVESTELISAFKKADLMLCDTSSIIYEFLTQLKPVVTFQTQKDEAHLINVQELDKLEDTILSVINDLDINKEEIKKSVEKFHPYTDGNSSNRLLDGVEKLLDGEGLAQKKKPFNIIRNFKLRKELNYWRI